MSLKKLLFTVVLMLTVLFGWSQELSNFGPKYKGLQLAQDTTKNFYLTNSFNTSIVKIDTSSMDTERVIKQIETSKVKDRELIVRILQMYSDKAKLIHEINNLATTFDEIATIVIKHLRQSLKSNMTKTEFKKLVNKE